MMNCKTVKADIKCPAVNAFTFPEGPRGVGIKDILQDKNKLIILFDNETSKTLEMPNWWFGTRDEYNSLSAEERASRDIYFIEEGT